jgi:hypothetical protein
MDFVLLKTISTHPDSSLGVPIVMEDVDRRYAIDPLASVQRRSGKTSDYALTPRPQPPGFGA